MRTKYFRVTAAGLEMLCTIRRKWDDGYSRFRPAELDGRVLGGLLRAHMVECKRYGLGYRVQLTDRGFAFACGLMAGMCKK